MKFEKLEKTHCVFQSYCYHIVQRHLSALLMTNVFFHDIPTHSECKFNVNELQSAQRSTHQSIMSCLLQSWSQK